MRGKLEDLLERRHEAEKILRNAIRKEDIAAFPVVVVEENIHSAIKALLQCHGLGMMRPNTLLLGWSEDPVSENFFYESLCTAKSMKRSQIIIASELEEHGTVPEGFINIWWSSQKNGELMLLLAYLLNSNEDWSDRSIRIIRPVAEKADIENIHREMDEILAHARIKAEVVIIPTDSPLEAVRQTMQPSAILLAGFTPPDDPSGCANISQLRSTIDLPGDIVLVYNAGDASIQV